MMFAATRPKRGMYIGMFSMKLFRMRYVHRPSAVQIIIEYAVDFRRHVLLILNAFIMFPSFFDFFPIACVISFWVFDERRRVIVIVNAMSIIM